MTYPSPADLIAIMPYHVTIDDSGRLVIPKPLRDRYGLSGGTRLQVRAEEGGVHLSVYRSGPILLERDGFLVLDTGTLCDEAVDHRDERERRASTLGKRSARR